MKILVLIASMNKLFENDNGNKSSQFVPSDSFLSVDESTAHKGHKRPRVTPPVQRDNANFGNSRKFPFFI